MTEHKEGKVISGRGKKVNSKKQAAAIAPRRGAKIGAEVPKKKESS
jgi:hypothetical protein